MSVSFSFYDQFSRDVNVKHDQKLKVDRRATTSIRSTDTTIDLQNTIRFSFLSVFIRSHWMDDWYFGHQCLNGCNPLMLRQTRLLPPRLSVTSDMLRPFLPEDSSLEKELQVCMRDS